MACVRQGLRRVLVGIQRDILEEMNPEEGGKKGARHVRPPGKKGRSGRFAKGWVC